MKQSTGTHLVIVESPAKARTIEKYLGEDFVVMASVGHIRDLATARELPEELKSLPWARLAVNVDGDFEGIYVTNEDKGKLISELKRAMKGADELYLATDEDREGEAISWHLLEVLQPKVPVHRMVFHEITKEAIARAVAAPRDLNMDLVQAQEARRKIDRLMGWEVSSILRMKGSGAQSAGRVQSVALRLIVDRERERIAFRSADFADLFAVLPPGFKAALHSVNGERVADGRAFDEKGQLVGKGLRLLSLADAEQLAAGLSQAPFSVAAIEEKPANRKPPVPFTTSTLQQEAGKKLRFSSKRTMDLAQDLYARGFITYMRTDSPSLSQQATNAARSQAQSLFGADTVPSSPRFFGASSKGAQEAHEAIRPAGDSFRTPKQVAGELNSDSLKLYTMIWQRTVASQMIDSKESTTTAVFDAVAQSGDKAQFRASGTVVVVPGWRAAYEFGREESDNGDEEETRLPKLEQGQVLNPTEVTAEGHRTKPPARYTEPALVKKMEELGIGRPSTYAATISVLQDRGYVHKPKGPALVPTWLAMTTMQLLETHFAELVDYEFTARMEQTLDEVAAGHASQVDVLRDFYWGGAEGFPGLTELLKDWGERIDTKAMATLSIPDSDILIVNGRYGPSLVRGDIRVPIPAELLPDEVTAEKAEEILANPVTDRVLGKHPDSGFDIVVKVGRFGPYVTEVLPEGTKTKGRGAIRPRTASLLKAMSPETVSFEQAIELMSLPREVGVDPEGRVITAQNGPYGPYLKRDNDSRTLPNEELMFTITLEEALAIYAQPKQRGRAAVAAPLAEYGNDPESQGLITLREGRFGLYVTDGVTNASLRVGDNKENLTPERAVELLADRRAKGPSQKRPRKAAKKAVAKPKAEAGAKPVKKAAKKAVKKTAKKAVKKSGLPKA